MPARTRKPKDPATDEMTKLDTSKFVDPNADPSKESTPLAYLNEVPEEDITHFEEDDDPLSLVGDLDGDGDVDSDDEALKDGES